MVLQGKTYYLEITFDHFLYLFIAKIQSVFVRAWDAIRWLPLRFLRLVSHIQDGISKLSKNTNTTAVLYWWSECMVLIISMLGVAEIYETIMDFVKFNTRPLRSWERRLAKSVYGNSINYHRVRIDEYALAACKTHSICYVSFYTINSWGKMHNSLFLHEMMHIWQYQRYGALYIPRSLAGGFSLAGYNYGGINALKEGIYSGKRLNAFNYEQQADIVADYYRISNGYRPRWGNATPYDLPVYETYMEDVRGVNN